MLQKLKNYYHLWQSIGGRVFYNRTFTGLTFIGVTGTDGKTTTSNLIYHILKTADINAAIVSTVSAKIGNEELDTGYHVTTPNAVAVQRYIHEAKLQGATHIVLEVTSHALDQNRVYGIPFEVAVLTNITEEHLDYHKTYENYLKAKVKLLLMAKTSIINHDDASYPPVIQQLKRNGYNGKIRTYGMYSDADMTPQKFPVKTKLLGDFNAMNILAAASAAKTLHIPDNTIKNAVASYNPPLGRTEFVNTKPFHVMIDFAHTPNSIYQLLCSLEKSNLYSGKLIHVFGSAGERDIYKRPLMGKHSAEFADVIILTAEDSRSESVNQIIEQIHEGVKRELAESKRKVEVYTIPNRQDAITKAISRAGNGDMVVITGKGHEQTMNLGNGEEPWSDHEAVKVALKKVS